MKYSTIGIDISKHFLDVCTLPDKKTYQFPNNIEGFQRFLKLIKKNQFDKIIMEDTGIYHKRIQKFLLEYYTNEEIFVINPQRLRAYAKSCGILAKTDKLDAFVIAEYGLKMNIVAKMEQSPQVAKLRAFVIRRRQLVDHQKKEKNYKESCLDEDILISINEKIKSLKKEILELDKKIKLLINEDKFFNDFFEELNKIAGVGKGLIATLLAYAPELGLLNNKQIAALIGVAPMSKDSGKKRGKRFIQDGRKEIRDVLFMATRSAVNSNEIIFNYFTNLEKRGKPYKVALIACMRKLLIYINLVVKEKFYSNI